MPLSTSSVTAAAMSKLAAKGFVTDNDHSKQNVMVEAIIEAVIEAIQTQAQVDDKGGTSPGLWQIK